MSKEIIREQNKFHFRAAIHHLEQLKPEVLPPAVSTAYNAMMAYVRKFDAAWKFSA